MNMQTRNLKQLLGDPKVIFVVGTQSFYHIWLYFVFEY